MKEKNIDTINSYWIVGFIDGNGCFSIFFNNKKLSLTCGIDVRPSFYIKGFSLQVLHSIKDYFKCGAIYFNKKD